MFRRIHLDLGWFYQFRQYWGNVLHGRPLWGVEDFFFLRNIYRMRFQYNCVPEKAEAGIHLQAWQQPELIYQLFDQTYRESMLADTFGVGTFERSIGRVTGIGAIGRGSARGWLSEFLMLDALVDECSRGKS